MTASSPEARIPADDSWKASQGTLPTAAASEIEHPARKNDGPADSLTAHEFENLSLAQALGYLWRSPRATMRALKQVVTTRDEVTGPAFEAVSGVARRAQPLPDVPAAPEEGPPRAISKGREASLLAVRLAAFLIALWGAHVLATHPLRSEDGGLRAGAPFLVAGFVLWLISEALPRLRDRSETIVSAVAPAEPVHTRLSYNAVAIRLSLVGLGAVASGMAWTLNANNEFTLAGVLAWVLSITAWAFALAPAGSNYRAGLRNAWARLRGVRLRGSWTLLILIAIIALGAHFRLRDLAATPPEMTSDHVEKLLDSWRVSQGQTDIFFANNGGREPAQMYLMALLAALPGVEMDFTALKLLSALEGLLALPLLWWLGREIVGKDDRRLGNMVGLALAALVAASYWHTAVSRLGLRIVLTTAVAAALLVFLSRAMRWNRREDFLKAGLVLGFGLYMYQAVRMLPVVIVAGVFLALLFRARTLRARRDYLLNLGALVLIAFVVFVPMMRYMYDYPEDFWRRTSGRLLGDDMVETTDAEGNVVRRNATIEERIGAFQENVPVLMNNIRTALLMFHWKGDVAWINGAPNAPAMDSIAGALLMVGSAAWLALIVRRRDVVYLLVPLVVFIMLLPSALSIAYPVENPSATRTSGAIPAVYLIAALPLALMARSLWRLIGGRAGAVVATGAAALLIGGSYAANAAVYFNDFRASYLVSSLPYSDAGRVLREFADDHGYGNAFMIAYPYWWDHRAVGIEGGVLDWPNGIVSLERVPQFLRWGAGRTDHYRLDPAKDLLFFFSPNDDATARQLLEWFPAGHAEERQSYQPEDIYRLYRVPALGAEGFEAWLRAHDAP